MKKQALRQKIRQYISLSATLTLLIVFVVSGNPVLAQEFVTPGTEPKEPYASQRALDSFLTDTPLYDETSECAIYGGGEEATTNPSGGSVSGPANAKLNLTAIQVTNALIIMGVAKTLNMGERGALIGIMTGITESHLRVLTNNKNVPLSKDQVKPSQGNGGDHDSLGMIQQRTSTGWSTYAGNVTNNIKGVRQLLNPVYNIQAFFGTPDGAQPQYTSDMEHEGAIKKGLLNRTNWRTGDPGAAAQTIQGSAFPDRYNENRAWAQRIVDEYFEKAQPVPLAIPLKGGGVNAPNTPPTQAITDTIATSCVPAAQAVANTGPGTCADKSINHPFFTTVCKYAWPTYHEAPFPNPAKDRTNPNNYKDALMPEYYKRIQAVKSKEYVGGGRYPGVDCGGFVTRLMRDSKVDTKYNGYQGPVTRQEDYLRNTPEKWTRVYPKTSKDLRPGDVFINQSQSHTYVFIGSGIFKGYNSASASISFTGESWRSPMASNAYDISGAMWYRPKVPITKQVGVNT